MLCVLPLAKSVRTASARSERQDPGGSWHGGSGSDEHHAVIVDRVLPSVVENSEQHQQECRRASRQHIADKNSPIPFQPQEPGCHCSEGTTSGHRHDQILEGKNQRELPRYHTLTQTFPYESVLIAEGRHLILEVVPLCVLTAVQNRQKSSRPCCKRELCVPGTGILRLRSTSVS
jgi:hypothetical protein